MSNVYLLSDKYCIGLSACFIFCIYKKKNGKCKKKNTAKKNMANSSSFPTTKHNQATRSFQYFESFYQFLFINKGTIMYISDQKLNQFAVTQLRASKVNKLIYSENATY